MVNALGTASLGTGGVLKELDRDVGAGKDGRAALVDRLEDVAPLVLETLPDSLAEEKLVLSKRHTRKLAEAQKLAKRIAGEPKTAVPNFENLEKKMTAD